MIKLIKRLYSRFKYSEKDELTDLIDDCLERISHVDYTGLSLKSKVILLNTILLFASDDSVNEVKKSCQDAMRKTSEKPIL